LGRKHPADAVRRNPRLALGIKLMTFGEHCSDINAINSGALLAEWTVSLSSAVWPRLAGLV